MSNDYIIYFSLVGIVIGYLVWQLLYQYYVDQFAIDVADVLAAGIGLVLAFIPYLNFLLAVFVIIKAVFSLVELLFGWLESGCIWIYTTLNTDELLKTVLIKSRRLL